MKRALIITMAFALAVALLAIVGCGSDDASTVKAPEGEVTSTGGNGDMKVDTEEDEGVEEAPLYPGAEYERGSLDDSGEPGVMSTSGITYITGDDYDKVVAWYEDKLGEPTEVTTDPYESTSWDNITRRQQGSDEPELSVTVRNDSKGVLISIDQITY